MPTTTDTWTPPVIEGLRPGPEVIALPRRAGKTTKLIEWATEFDRPVYDDGTPAPEVRIIVVSGEENRTSLLAEIRQTIPGFEDHRVVTYEGIQRGRLRGNNSFVLGLDDIEFFFPHGYRIGAITVSTEV